ncbi:NADP-dependent oxidoreductase [Collimonas pratensis]|uniref:Zinc-binding dehydrogenase family protein n=1 Tax=Collimonas pratensis TaxID=279113 RepID=A0ABM5Z4P5_9BURK|nr:NADP-dependent oxidoreductase [Collimonas pratensis]AMP14010.1 zinc-binding dehydrogenase family protein [Collimonas pratensis]
MKQPNKAVRIHSYGNQEVTSLDLIDIPQPAAGKVVVRVHAAGVNAIDRKIREGVLKDYFPLPFPITLGAELSGTVHAVGAEVDGFFNGMRVFGFMPTLGAFADYVEVDAALLTSTPDGLPDVVAASLPIAALTAWQALFETGQLKAGQIVLIQGAAGGVGSMAVQLAKRAGARVIATASARNLEYVAALGADVVVDYRAAQPFAHLAASVDLVLDLAGGPALDLLWPLLREAGVLVSTAAPELAARTPANRTGLWFQMRPEPQRLAEIAALVLQREIKAEVASLFPLDSVSEAIDYGYSGKGRGKAVVQF